MKIVRVLIKFIAKHVISIEMKIHTNEVNRYDIARIMILDQRAKDH